MKSTTFEKKELRRLPELKTKPETLGVTAAIVGLGYVGFPLALLLAQRGYDTVGFDINHTHVEALNNKESPLLSKEDGKILDTFPLKFSTETTILNDADIVIVCVPTPVHDNHTPDLQPLIAACTTVGKMLKPGALVIIESTVNPGVCEDVALKTIEEESGLEAEEDFLFAHAPERINPGDSYYSVENIPRVVGGIGPESLARALAFYRSILKAPVKPMETIAETEAVKMVENSFRDINIAFVNELAMAFDKAGIDLTHVIEGASTKPFGFLPHFPGCGVGGHCIPVDPYYLIRYGRENGFEHRFLIAARNINNHMPYYTVDLLERALKEQGMSLKGTRVALLGMTYKRDVPDLRESPALTIREELKRRGAHLSVFDPLVPKESDCGTLSEALTNAEAVVLATDHSIFTAKLTPQFLKEHGATVVIDGRNCLPKNDFLEAGIHYQGIGR